MRILLVCQYYSPEPFRVTDIARELSRAGHEVSVWTGIPNYPEGIFYSGFGLFSRRRESQEGVRINRLPVVPRGKGGALALALNYLSFALSGTIKACTVRRSQFDVVLVYQLSPVLMAIPGVLAARRARAPLVNYVVDLWPESLAAAGGTGNKAVIRLFGRIVDWIYRQAVTIFVSSSGFIEPIVGRGQPRTKLRYIPQYPEEVYRPAKVAPEDPARSEMPSGFTIVFTGNIGVAQGLEVVIDAASELSRHDDIHWVIIGDGRARSDLETSVKARGLDARVRFLGRRPMDRIPAYLALADVALLCLGPEPLFALTLPAKVQSYFACGIPVVGSVNGDAARVIREAEAGLVGPAGDGTALAANVLELYHRSKQERDALAANALRYYEANFRKEKLLAEIEEGLRKAVSPNE